MRLEVEGRKSIDDVSVLQVQSAIDSLRSYGPCSFASLIDKDGNYVQVAGGGVTCMLEHRLESTNSHFRAYKTEKSAVFVDGTILSFGGGKIKMRSDEWMTSIDVKKVFLAFLEGNNLPDHLMWRDITSYIYL